VFYKGMSTATEVVLYWYFGFECCCVHHGWLIQPPWGIKKGEDIARSALDMEETEDDISTIDTIIKFRH